MRRPSTIELLLLATVVPWALNLTVTRYILTEGSSPSTRPCVTGWLAIVLGSVLVAEGTLRSPARDLSLVGVAERATS